MSPPGPALKAAAIPGWAVATLDEQAAAEYLARTLAMALANPDLRLEVKMAIATSTMKEHKLHFASFMQGRGGRIVAAMDKQDRSSFVGVQSAVARVRDLEFYMPVPEHSQKWTGGEDVLVGVGLSEKEAPIAFNSRGERIVLSATVPPETPTLFLVPNETDLSPQIALNRQGRAAVACLPIATESLKAAGARCTAGRSAGFVPTAGSSILLPPSGVSKGIGSDSQVTGLRMTFLRLLDDGEPYQMGDPEIEIHVIAKQSAAASEIHDYQCSGEHAMSSSQPGIRGFEYVFDMNDHFWQNHEPVLLINSSQMEEIQQDEQEGYALTVYEDDNEACAIREDADITLRDLLQNLKMALPTGKVGVKSIPIGPGAWVMIGFALISGAQWLAGGDDLLGIIVDKRETDYYNQYPDNTHVVLEENKHLNGRATIDIISAARLANVSGPTAAYPGYASNFSASATGTSGALTYTFTLTAPDGNGPIVIQSGPASAVSYADWGYQGPYTVGVNVTDSYGSVGASSMQVNIQPPPPPPGFSVSIQGNNPTQAGCATAWLATAQNGSSPYTYSWTINGTPYDSGQGEVLTYTPSEGSFTLGVGATDANGAYTSTATIINVTAGNCT
jgi:hypothetical protein